MLISGRVVKGERHKIDFPTANIRFNGKERGVYAVYVYISGKKYKGVANIGYAPTFGRRRGVNVGGAS